MSFISDSNEIARQLKQKRHRLNPAKGKRVKIEVPANVFILDTDEAAKMLNRRPQTLRMWACKGGPIAPVRIHGRLGWKVADVEALLNGQEA